MNGELSKDRGSFRDPSGHVFEYNGRIIRAVSEHGRAAYEAVRELGVIATLATERRLVRSDELSRDVWPDLLQDASYVLEHDRVPFISYPYEWCFGELKAAALHHLDLQLSAFDQGVVLSDASAYNVQFNGSKPVFIDTLSLRPYREGEFWHGHRQFCEQFLNPLLLRSLFGIPHNAWFRGRIEGIPTVELARLLSPRHYFSPRLLLHVALQAKLESRAVSEPDRAIQKARSARSLPATSYRGLLAQLRGWISKLEPADTGKTVWGTYASTNTYSDEETEVKKQAIRDFASSVRPKCLLDLGCNTGNFSVAALEGGAERVIGFDFDHRAVDLAYARAAEEGLNFLPLWLDAANPSPDQGWNQHERRGFAARVRADAVIALAFEHHLAIGKNIPLQQVVEWLISTAPVGIIEFVPKSDPTIQKMLALREDIFFDYTEESFVKAVSTNSSIIAKQTISTSGRALFHYSRR